MFSPLGRAIGDGDVLELAAPTELGVTWFEADLSGLERWGRRKIHGEAGQDPSRLPVDAAARDDLIGSAVRCAAGSDHYRSNSQRKLRRCIRGREGGAFADLGGLPDPDELAQLAAQGPARRSEGKRDHGPEEDEGDRGDTPRPNSKSPSGCM
jgi:hypothetical protein